MLTEYPCDDGMQAVMKESRWSDDDGGVSSDDRIPLWWQHAMVMIVHNKNDNDGVVRYNDDREQL